MKNKFFLLLSTIPFIVACSNIDGVGKRSYYLDRSLDLPSKVEDGENGYKATRYYNGSDEIISALESGQDILLSTSSDNCSHCADFDPTFSSYVIKSKLVFGMLGLENKGVAEYRAMIDQMNNYYGYVDGDDGYLDGATPTLYLLNKERCVTLQLGPTSFNGLDTKLKAKCTYTNTYRTRKYSSLAGISDNSLVFLFDSTDKTSSDFYASSFRDVAKKSKTKSYVIDYGSMNEEDKASTLSKYGLDSYSPTLIKGNSIIDIKNASADAEALIKSSLS